MDLEKGVVDVTMDNELVKVSPFCTMQEQRRCVLVHVFKRLTSQQERGRGCDPFWHFLYLIMIYHMHVVRPSRPRSTTEVHRLIIPRSDWRLIWRSRSPSNVGVVRGGLVMFLIYA